MVKSTPTMQTFIASLLRMTLSSKFKTRKRGQERHDAGGRRLASALQWCLVPQGCRGGPEFSFRSAPCRPRCLSCRTGSGFTSVVSLFIMEPPKWVCGSRERQGGRRFCITPHPTPTHSPPPASGYICALTPLVRGPCIFNLPEMETRSGETCCMSPFPSLSHPFPHDQCWPHSALVARDP